MPILLAIEVPKVVLGSNIVVLPKIILAEVVISIQKSHVFLLSKVIYGLFTKFLKVYSFFDDPLLDFKVFHVIFNFIWLSTFVFTWSGITLVNSKLPIMLQKTFFNIVGMQNLSLFMIWTYHLVTILIKKVVLCFGLSILCKMFFSIAINSINKFL